MPGPDFLDTNVLVCAYDVTEPARQRVAQDLVRQATRGEAMISTQVLAEFAVTLLHKVVPAIRPEDLSALLDVLGPIPLITPDADLVRRSVDAHAAYGLHFYDAMIIAAAERGECTRIWSEDMNPGQTYFGVAVVNPFA